MSGALAGVAAALVVLAAGAATRPRPPVRRLRPPTAGEPRVGESRVDRGTATLLGRLGLPLGTPAQRGRLRRAAGLGVVLAASAPPLAPLPVLGVWLLGHRHARQRARADGRAVVRALPDAVDLLALCTSAGLTIPLAQPLLAEALGPPLGPALAAAHLEAGHGRARADALTRALCPLGDGPASLAHVMADHLRYGTTLAPALERLGVEVRLRRRHLAEEQARRVPVRLLGPLVACVLPAFALLTVVPLLVASLQTLPT